MIHPGESRIPVPKARRATGESVYRPTPRSTPPTSTRPRANTGAASMDSKKLGIQSPPVTPHPPMPSSAGLAVPKSKADYRISDLIADPNFNPFLPSTPSTFSPSMESSVNILGRPSSQMISTSLSPTLPTPSESPESTPTATMRGGRNVSREASGGQDPLSTTHQQTWSRDTSTASPESTSSATMGSSGTGRDELASSTTLVRPNHDDMILPVVAKRIKAEGLKADNIIAYGEGEDAPLYRVRETPGMTGGAKDSYDPLKTTSSVNVAKQSSANDTSIPSSPELNLPTPPLPTQQGRTHRSRPAEPPSLPSDARSPPEPSTPTSHYNQQQLPSPPRSSQDNQSPTRPPRAQRPPRHTATAALADQVRQEENARARWNDQAYRDERNMEYLHDSPNGGGYSPQQRQRLDHPSSPYGQDNDSYYGRGGTGRPMHRQSERDQWNNYEPPVPAPSRRPNHQQQQQQQQQSQQWPSQGHDAYGAQEHGRMPYSPYGQQQHSPSSFQDSQQFHPYASIDMPVKPEQQQQQHNDQRPTIESAAPAPKKKKSALCCVIS
ncbi:hypothetical protein BGZ73_007712 [Actinomortierella ambigua]|nr:hypothetical protein BGZ73_007712 [Actinomortierella ambigua]